MASIKRNKYDLQIIAEEIKKITKVKDGNVSFTSFSYEDFITVLQTSINFRGEIPEIEKRSIVQRGVSECAKNKEITSQGW